MKFFAEIEANCNLWYQTQLLQQTWSRLKSTTTFTQVFKLLCFKSTVSREMFQKMSIVEGFRTNQCCDLNMHAKVGQ
ncbi:hypothetical protein ANCCAN_22529 [Ancylostoma caninum]|uniref:Uncharacterized protein n=1 Tax=Ancylostoma caninum TaxID=29170 RepID=A0A368FNC5_ANCCA|nr:hypothetical protein ANCCAN_22529 [Ancylostoma caninum]